MLKRIRLTPELRQQILAGVRAGGYPHVAAVAWGVPRAVFDQWLARGQAQRAREPYASFHAEVEQAHAQVRLRAEMAMVRDTPRHWLEHGPGRETMGNPGWSSAVASLADRHQDFNPFMHPELVRFHGLLCEMLQPYPELRCRMKELTGMGPRRTADRQC